MTVRAEEAEAIYPPGAIAPSIKHVFHMLGSTSLLDRNFLDRARTTLFQACCNINSQDNVLEVIEELCERLVDECLPI